MNNIQKYGSVNVNINYGQVNRSPEFKARNIENNKEYHEKKIQDEKDNISEKSSLVRAGTVIAAAVYPVTKLLCAAGDLVMHGKLKPDFWNDDGFPFLIPAISCGIALVVTGATSIAKSTAKIIYHKCKI